MLMRHNTLADVFSTIRNAESIGKNACVTPASTLARDVLKVLQEHGYIGAFEHTDTGKGGIFKISLMGKINQCGAIRPRFSVGKTDFTEWEKRFLPASSIGILIVSTSKGIVDQNAARKLRLGGKLLGFVY